MASRSFKPATASYLATQPTKRRSRPSSTRSSSASSAKSVDSIIATLKNLTTVGNTHTCTSSTDQDSTGGVSPRCHTPVNIRSSSHQSIDDTPGRKRSNPIAIELPSRSQPVYTPLSARGDLPGGYFPYHEALPKSYKSHPFSQYPQADKERRDRQEASSEPSSPLFVPSPAMSNTSSEIESPAETNTRASPSIISPVLTVSLPVPEVLTKSMGKYHPSNYKVPAKSAPISIPSLPSTNLSLPLSVLNRKKEPRLGHERHGSDVKRKLQEYQLGQMKQAQLSALALSEVGSSEPTSPRLLPLGSPGPITPFELENSTDTGYVVAGARARSNSLSSRAIERDRDRELVGRMIQVEEDRRVLGGKEGSQSSVLRA